MMFGTSTMQRSARVTAHMLLRAVAVLTTLLFVLAIQAPAVWSAETVGAGYTASTLVGGAGPYTCDTWSGDSDGAGNFYVPCRSNILVISPTGALVQVIPAPAGLEAFRDVTVDAMGTVIYYVPGRIDIDNPNPTTDPGLGSVQRLVRNADASWRHDTTFNLGYPVQIGLKLWSARNLDLDLAGRLYVSVNAYVRIYEGVTMIGQFGGDDRYNGATYLEGLEIAEGIAATPDGQHVYVVEQRRNHVQRWDRTATGDWVRSTWRIGQLGPASDCVDNNSFASPYDVALDGSGGLYVMDVTCRRIQKYDSATGAFTGTIWSNYGGTGNLYHGIAVNYAGDLAQQYIGRLFRHTPAAACAPDSDAPVVARITVPNVNHGRAIDVETTATDRCSKVTSVRVTGDVTGANAGSWLKLGAPITVQLSGADGPKTLVVAVRDTYGRIGTRTVATTLDTTIPALVARRIVRVSGVARYCGTANPLRRIANRSAYVLVDRCATLSGRVSQVQRTGTTRLVQVQLSMQATRRLYRNPRIAAKIWVVGSVRTPGRAPRTGKALTFTSALLATKRLSAVSAAPVYHWSRA